GIRSRAAKPDASRTKSLIVTFWGSMRVRGSDLDRTLAHAAIARMRRLDEEGRLLDPLMGELGAEITDRLAVHPEQELLELVAGERVVEELGVVEAGPELGHDRLGVLGHVQVHAPRERLGGGDHGGVGELRGLHRLSLVEEELGLEDLALAGGQTELHEGDDL